MLTHLVSLIFSSKRQPGAEQASSSVGNPWQDTDLWSSEKPARGVESFPSVERSLSRGKRDRDFESVQTSQKETEKILSGRRNLNEYLKKEAQRVFKR